VSRFDYDVIVIGGGAAGMVSSKLARGLGRKVALVEKGKLGGECTNYGCVPSKALIKAANVYHYRAHVVAADYGLSAKNRVEIDQSRVMTHVRNVVQKVYDGHPPAVFEKLGIDVVFGNPVFANDHHIQVDGKVLSAGSFIICTGSSALVPPIEGMDSVPYLTNQNVFDLARLPRSMIILGGGPIGTELAQALNRLGVKITIVEMGDQILIREDRELRDLLAERLYAEGITILTKTKAVKVSHHQGSILLTVEYANGETGVVEAESLLVAVGRKANVVGLSLEKAGVDYTQKGIKTDAALRTSAKNIYACGDVVGPYQFSHMAEYQARIAAQNLLFPVKKHADYEHYVWCTFTDPELAHAGLTEEEAREKYGDGIKVYRWRYEDTDRGKTDVEGLGMSKVICDDKYRVLGAHILGSRAGELLHEIQVIKTLGIPFYKLDSVIHIYPTFSDVIKQPAKVSHIEKVRQNPFVRMLGGLFGPKRN
jgi:pyruvate/2-oxoglutarate dehydrogenase complex dihydrolipoamide dehydrogenase (E3) component